jgi:DNA polymerase III epsilon subunit-like protein
MNSDTKILFMDVETTGLDAYKHEIIQISGILEINDKVIDAFNYKGRPNKVQNISEDALVKQGKSIKEILEYPAREDMYNNVLTFFNKYVNCYDSSDYFILAGYNTTFDRNFLYSLFNEFDNKYMNSYIFKYYIDVMEFAKMFWLNGKLNSPDLRLMSVCEAIGMPFKNAHDAMEDIKATYKAYKYFNKRITLAD